jgi:hypothetical protein
MPIVSLRRPSKTERVRLPHEPEDIRLHQEIYDHRSDRNLGADIEKDPKRAEAEARLPQQVPRRFADSRRQFEWDLIGVDIDPVSNRNARTISKAFVALLSRRASSGCARAANMPSMMRCFRGLCPWRECVCGEAKWT